jgi:NAD(P)-dependent dehydrogenase (short-subunit alcohol dehydrogenase family)
MLSSGIGGGDIDINIDWSALAKGNPRKRVSTPEDIAGHASFFFSRASAHIVGETITCDGGPAYAP